MIRSFTFRVSIVVALLLSLIASVTLVQGQSEQEDKLVVAFVTGFNTGGYLENDTSGFWRFTVMFSDIGATTREIEIDGAIPEDVDLLILPGLKSPTLSEGQAIRIWQYVQRGGSLLVLLDAPPNNGIVSRNTLTDLLWQNYGIRWHDDLIAEKWFSQDTMTPVSGRGFRNQPQRIASLSAEPIEGHPLTDLLVDYGLDLYYWHSRSLELQAPAFMGSPVPLFQATDDSIGETDTRDAPSLDIGRDTQGDLLVGAAVEDDKTEARIVILGDSDLFKNGYGLEYASNTGLPLQSGNDLFAKALMRWMLKLPLDDIQLPTGPLWIAIDGDATDWETIPSSLPNDEQAILTEFKIARSDRRTYFLLGTQDIADPVSAVVIETVDSTNIMRTTRIDVTEPDIVSVIVDDSEVEFWGGQAKIGDFIEFAVPANALPIGLAYQTTKVCVEVGELMCLDTNIARPQQLGIEPRGKGLLPSFRAARVNSSVSANMFESPGLRSYEEIEPNTMVSVLAEDETGQWLNVWVDGISGWVSVDTLSFPYSNEPTE